MMDKILEYYLEEKKVTKPVAKVLSAGFERNPDIADEFCKWIDSREYLTDNAISINGYTAKKISEIAPHLDAAGVFSFLITLREKPEKAEETIRKNFPEK